MTLKPRKNSAPRPTVKFYDVKSKIFSKSAKNTSSEELPDDDDDDSWLDEAREVYESVQELDAEKSSPIDLASKHLKTFLSYTKPEDGSGIEALPLHADKPKFAVAPFPVEDDNDFSMEF